jgi:hypothetical protein
MQLLIFSVRVNKKYIGLFSYRVGNPVKYPPFIAQFWITYCTNCALFSHSGVTGYTRWVRNTISIQLENSRIEWTKYTTRTTKCRAERPLRVCWTTFKSLKYNISDWMWQGDLLRHPHGKNNADAAMKYRENNPQRMHKIWQTKSTRKSGVQ